MLIFNLLSVIAAQAAYGGDSSTTFAITVATPVLISTATTDQGATSSVSITTMTTDIPPVNTTALAQTMIVATPVATPDAPMIYNTPIAATPEMPMIYQTAVMATNAPAVNSEIRNTFSLAILVLAAL
ncbi:hypothetical protein HDV01_005185 [Terramyces sp. JEL0728]|nr:hypothetical protein HDV01_005185 [Terramyces sp. JEL0728]